MQTKETIYNAGKADTTKRKRKLKGSRPERQQNDKGRRP
jgi:hypothetical protein